MIEVVVLRQVEEIHKERLRKEGINLLVRIVQKVELYPLSAIDLSLLSKGRALLFTSQHAVVAWLNIVSSEGLPDPLPGCFALEGKTATTAREAGLHILGAAPNAAALSTLIRQSGAWDVVHLCAADRLPVLAEQLKDTQVAYIALPVYKKLSIPFTLPSHQAVVIFSPSQWRLYRRATAKAPREVFCIGDTTAAAVKEGLTTDTQLLIAAQPSQTAIIDCIQKYYSN